jgi:subtilisin family serine protease
MRRVSLLVLMTLLGLLAIVAFPRPASGAVIHEGLERHMMTLGDSDPVSVMIFMRDQADIASLNAQLKQERATLAVRNTRVVQALHAAAERSQGDLLAELEAAKQRGEVTGYTSYWIANLVVAQATKAYVHRLAAREDVEQIEINLQPELITPINPDMTGGPGRGIGVTPGLRAINAPQVWYELGITGTGVIIGSCDTGVDGNHPALASRWRGNFAPASECWLNLIGGAPNFPYDGYGHGTHTTGTMTGLGASTQDTIGVAWSALWIATDPINQGVGSGFDSDITAAYQWFTDPDGNPNTTDEVPDVVQNSWGVYEGLGYPDCDTRWYTVIDNCEAAGVCVTWSAGNEGSGAGSLRSPADRATTLTNCFSVGAVDATHYTWPYPIASWSSRGPSGCTAPPENRIKPEVVAPGVDVYSCVPGGGYSQSWSGTSMAGPHVAGVVGLMREASPDLDVDTIKEILMATARDLGTAGEENTYGWGLVDAYAAVVQSMSGYGTIEGAVRNASNGNTPVAGATVTVLETETSTQTNSSGQYTLHVPAGTYTVQATHWSFTTGTQGGVVVTEGNATIVYFALNDIGAPVFTGTTQYNSTDDQTGPYLIQSTVTDFSMFHHVSLIYMVNGGAPNPLTMSLIGGVYQASIPGQSYTSHVEYYVEAQDVAGNRSTDPLGAPVTTYDFYVAPISDLFSDTMEGGQGAWTHSNVSGGYTDQWHLSTTRNHTTGGATSWKCGDTGTGTYANLLDAGLVTPSVELGLDSYLHYWQWVAAETSAAYSGRAYDGGIVEISLNGGAWQQITPDGGYPFLARAGSNPGPFPVDTPMFSGNRNWHAVHFNLGAYEGTARIRFRFGSDGATGREGWYVDDVVVDGFNIGGALVPETFGAVTLRLLPADPNPFSGETRMRYALGAASDVLVQIFDASGRLVRTLEAGHQPAGQYEVRWDGRDADARPVPTGLYLSRVQAGSEVATRKLILTR